MVSERKSVSCALEERGNGFFDPVCASGRLHVLGDLEGALSLSTAALPAITHRSPTRAGALASPPGCVDLSASPKHFNRGYP